MGRVRARRGRSGDVYYQVVRKRMNEEAGNRASRIREQGSGPGLELSSINKYVRSSTFYNLYVRRTYEYRIRRKVSSTYCNEVIPTQVHTVQL